MNSANKFVATPRLIGLLALAWLTCTLVNVTKAVHIDDTVHVAIAEHIIDDPLHPMSGRVFWGEAPAPIHHLNQPHLLFYLLAATLAASGGSLFAAHVLIAIFTGLVALFAFRLGRAVGLSSETATWGAAALLLGPAFVPSQNLMTDVPVLALWLAAFDALARSGGARGDRGAWLSAFYVGLACLVKYTSLVLLPILAIDAIVRRRRRRLFTLLVPIGFLAAWSLFNIFDYGSVHLLGRPIDSARVGGVAATVGVVLGRAALFVMTLGAVAPFTIAALPGTLARRGRGKVFGTILVWLIFAVLLAQGLAAWGPTPMRGEPIVLSLLRGLFVLNGFYAVVLTFAAYRRLRSGGERTQIAALLGAWALGTTLFVVALSPFVAVRHVLMVLPAVLMLLLSSRALPTTMVALTLTAALGLMVALSDYRLAAVYRDAAESLGDGSTGRNTFFVGHWGFQHYAEAAGLLAYVPAESELAPCDVLIRPVIVDQQSISDRDLESLTLVEERTIDATLLDLPRTMTTRLGFYSVWHGVPYTFTLEPVETFEIYEAYSRQCASSRAAATD